MNARKTAMLVSCIALAPRMLAAQGAEGGEGGGLVSLNLALSLWTVVIFLALLAILWKYAWDPILGAVTAREEGIQKALDEAAEGRAEASRLLEQHRARLDEARRESQDIIAAGKAAADRVRKEMEDKARLEAAAIVERARDEILREKDAAMADLRRESVELALAAASRLLHENLDRERNRRLVMDYLGELDPERGGEAPLA